MIRRALTIVIAGALMLSGLIAARPAQAMTCAEDIEDACRIAATVVCDVVAKGRPCLM